MSCGRVEAAVVCNRTRVLQARPRAQAAHGWDALPVVYKIESRARVWRDVSDLRISRGRRALSLAADERSFAFV